MFGYQRFLVGSAASQIAANPAPCAGFVDRLDRHFERKIVWMSTAPAIIAQ
jgi:hypothetical protein